MGKHFKFVIIGGGTGGITMAARLAKKVGAENIAIVEPSDSHYYQPAFTLVAAGIMTQESTRRPMASVIPPGVTWIKDSAAELLPDEKSVKLNSGTILSYEFLVVATGLVVDFGTIEGLKKEDLGKNGLFSIYDYDIAPKGFDLLSNFTGGKTIFIMPPVPIKCAGAPQKIMYLTDEILREKGIREKSSVHFYSAGLAIFGIPVFAQALKPVVERKGIETHFQHRIRKIDAAAKVATFERLDQPGTMVEVKYDLCHVVPLMHAHDFISKSKLAWQDGPHKGWLKVDQYTLQNPDYPNVFAVGDVAGIPVAKTGAAVRKQAPIIVDNILAVMAGKKPQPLYNGYTSCPLVTGKGSVILAEFGYNDKVLPSFPLDPSKERYAYWLLKRYALPLMYWHGMLKGRA